LATRWVISMKYSSQEGRPRGALFFRWSGGGTTVVPTLFGFFSFKGEPLIKLGKIKCQMTNIKCPIKSKAQTSNPPNPPLLKGGEGGLLIDFEL
jgi:hypothetical protein